MICVDTLPISFIENRGFKELLRHVIPAYKIPVKKTIQLRIDAMYDTEKQKIFDEISTMDFIALTTDCWSSRSNESYITLTVHYINSSWQPVARNITTEPMEERHTAENLALKIENILTEWEIRNKAMAIVHDNAANIVAAVSRNLPYESVSCFAHSLQLVLNKVLNGSTIKPIIDKCSRIVTHFRHSNVATSALTSKQSQLGLEKHKLIQSVKTRWNSTFYMLKRLIEQREALISILSDRTITNRAEAGQFILIEDEWTLIENMAKILEPFELVTTLMSSDSKPTISMVIPILQSIVENFLSNESNEDETEEFNKVRCFLLQELKSRFKNVLDLDSNCSAAAFAEVTLLDLSTYLDPRFKNKERYLGSLLKTKEYLKNILDKEENEPEEVLIHPAKKTALDILFPSEHINVVNEVDMYHSEPAIQKSLCPLQWWKSNVEKYPKLSNLACCKPGL